MFISEYNLNSDLFDKIYVYPDGNCFIRCISLYVYKNEIEYFRVHNEIANYLYKNHHQFENISIPTEDGWKSIHQYIIYMRLPTKWSGHLEMYGTNILYNINIIMTMVTILDNNNNTIEYKYVYKFNFGNNMNKDLCIITNIFTVISGYCLLL